MKLRLNISPCPNDTFMFDALINRRIDTRGIDFQVTYLDIEQLNNTVLSGIYAVDISKISYAVLRRAAKSYCLLDSGSALGRGNGPLMVARGPVDKEQYPWLRVAIPGEFTTAGMLLSLFFPQIEDKPVYLFSDIADAVREGEVDAGVLIHEGRFTFERHGLHLLHDLGELWEQATSMPLPLGGIVVSRDLPAELRATVEDLLRQSVRYALDHPGASAEFVRSKAQEMDEQVIQKHIEMFVNDYSLSLGPEGRAAVCKIVGEDENTLFK